MAGRIIPALRLVAVLLIASMLAGAAGGAGIAAVGARLPSLELPAPAPLPRSSVILDVRGDRIAVLHDATRRHVVAHSDIPKILIEAVLAVEDRRFYEHAGVSLRGIARAVAANARSGTVVQGGSTVTQQYVRAAYPSVDLERTVGRKVMEALLALRAEQRHSKQEILERYLNSIYLGRGLYGVEAASRGYFGKPVKRLEIEEAALLAGMIRAPERYADDLDAARARRDYVIGSMAKLGSISPDEAATAAAKPVRLREISRRDKAPYFVEFVRRLLKKPVESGGFGLADEEIYGGGLRIHTTLDLRMQAAAEKAVRAVLSRRGDPEVGLVALATTGEIRAMVGGKETRSVARARGFNFATQQAKRGGREPGSTFKAFALAAFVRRGYSVRSTFPAPARMTIDRCRTASGDPWRPENYGGRGYGRLSVVRATMSSVNTVYAQLAALVGPKRIAAAARDAGIRSRIAPVCSLVLGSSGVTPLEMARAYATFAARGVRPEVFAVRQVVRRTGEVLSRERPRARRVFERRTADIVNRVLARVVAAGTGRPASIDRPAAGKTGTSERLRDLWFVGYTPHPGLSTAVWVGHPAGRDGSVRPVSSFRGGAATGGRVAGGIWRRFMARALADAPKLEFARVGFRGKVIRSGEREPRKREAKDEERREPVANPAKPKRQAPKRQAPKRREASPSPKPSRAPGPVKVPSAEEPDPPADPEPAPDPTPSPEPSESPQATPSPEPSESPEPATSPDPTPSPSQEAST